MTNQAESLVRQIGEDLSGFEQALRAHPYPRAFRSGSASIEALTPFLGHQYYSP